MTKTKAVKPVSLKNAFPMTLTDDEFNSIVNGNKMEIRRPVAEPVANKVTHAFMTDVISKKGKPLYQFAAENDSRVTVGKAFTCPYGSSDRYTKLAERFYFWVASMPHAVEGDKKNIAWAEKYPPKQIDIDPSSEVFTAVYNHLDAYNNPMDFNEDEMDAVLTPLIARFTDIKIEVSKDKDGKKIAEWVISIEKLFYFTKK